MIDANGSLAGRTAPVIEAGRGIGAAIAARLAMAGARVAVSARTAEKGQSRRPGTLAGTMEQLKAAGAGTVLIRADLAQAGDRRRLVRQAQAMTGRVAHAEPFLEELGVKPSELIRALAVSPPSREHTSRYFASRSSDRMIPEKSLPSASCAT